MERSCGAIITYNNKALLVLQDNGDVCFPKGHVEGNESLVETAIREVKEETNLDIQIDKNKCYKVSYFTNKGIYKEVIYYLARACGNINLIPQKGEIKKIIWVNRNEVSKYLTHNNLKEIWNKIVGNENKYLEKEIRLNKKQYELFLSLVEKYKKKYSKKIGELIIRNRDSLNTFNYKNEVKLINDQNKLVKEILINLKDEFKIFKIFHVTIFITGSFARKSNKLNSDIDIHFLYSNLFKSFIWIYEEMYFCIVSLIFNIERNNIHSVITTKLSKHKLYNYDKLKDDTYLKVKLLYKDQFNFEYNFYPVTKKRFFLQYKNSKNYYAFNKYIKSEILNNNREWAHNFYPIMNSEKFNKNLNMLMKYEFSNNKILNNIDDIISNIKNSLSDSNDIKDIKNIYQQKTFGNIFNTLNIIRYLEGDTNFVMDKIFKYKVFTKNFKFNRIESLIYEYLWLVKKISYYCDKVGIPYSIHKSNIVNIDFISKVREKQIEVNEVLIELLNYAKEEIICRIEQ